MAKQRLTSKQVAQLAGVSQTTVSFVLNHVDSANISEKTKQRVWDAASALGYQPNVAARALASGRSTTIALVIDFQHAQVFIDEYIPKVMTGLSSVMRQHGYRILVELAGDGHARETFVNLIRGKEVAGIVLNHDSNYSNSLDELVQHAEKGFPIVALDDCHPKLNTIMVDKIVGARRAVDHLIALGHRRIACITYGPIVEKKHVYKRLIAYREALEAVGIAYDETLVRIGEYDPETGTQEMNSLLDLPNRPTAIFAMNDMMAFGAIKACYDRGLRVPEDIAIVGFDDVRLAAFARPALTTVHEPDIEHGRLAGETLMRMINGESVPRLQRLATRLIIRDSCGARQKGWT